MGLPPPLSIRWSFAFPLPACPGRQDRHVFCQAPVRLESRPTSNHARRLVPLSPDGSFFGTAVISALFHHSLHIGPPAGQDRTSLSVWGETEMSIMCLVLCSGFARLFKTVTRVHLSYPLNNDGCLSKQFGKVIVSLIRHFHEGKNVFFQTAAPVPLHLQERRADPGAA